MARVAVAHTDLLAKGGGEGVCMNTLEALQRDHRVTLVTLTHPDWPALNRYFNTRVSDVAVRVVPVVRRLLDRSDLPLYNLQNALLNRAVRRHRDAFDLVISTDNEISPSPPAIQYIHTPRFGRLVTSKRVGEDSFVDHLYDRLSYRLGGYDADRIRSSVLLTNSQWMANVVQDVYDVRPRVLYPPVDTSDFTDVPWADRERGFVTIGRLERYKNVETTIEIVDGVRDRGHDVHQHVVGPASDPAYRREIESLAAGREYVHLEGERSRADLVRLIDTHRYGLHGKRNEHFGMAVAELAAGGTIPFVPDSGGQQDIVERRPQLCYATPDDAVDKIDAVLSDRSLQAAFRTDAETVERRFGRRRFAEAMCRLVAELLAESDRPVP